MVLDGVEKRWMVLDNVGADAVQQFCPHREICQCHLNIARRKLFMPSSA